MAAKNETLLWLAAAGVGFYFWKKKQDDDAAAAANAAGSALTVPPIITPVITAGPISAPTFLPDSTNSGGANIITMQGGSPPLVVSQPNVNPVNIPLGGTQPGIPVNTVTSNMQPFVNPVSLITMPIEPFAPPGNQGQTQPGVYNNGIFFNNNDSLYKKFQNGDFGSTLPNGGHYI